MKMKKLALVVFALFALGATPLFAQAQAPAKPVSLPTKSVCPPGKKMCGHACIAASLKCDESTKARAEHDQNMAKAKKTKQRKRRRRKLKLKKKLPRKRKDVRRKPNVVHTAASLPTKNAPTVATRQRRRLLTKR